MTVAEAKLSGYLADLILCVKEDDLDGTMHVVDAINNQGVLSAEFDFQAILSPNDFYNDSAIYAVTNLNNINRREEFLMIQQINKLYLISDKDKVIEFLNTYGTAEYLSQMELYLVSRLYQLCIDFDLWDKLSELRDIFNSIQGE